MEGTGREYKITFGKYTGETLEEIYLYDIGYLDWLFETIEKKSESQVTFRDGQLKKNIQQCYKEMRKVRIY